jgi:hypothetical protein
MDPVNNCIATNEISQPISDAFLRKKYGITEQYSKDHPEGYLKVLSVVRVTEEALQEVKELRQNLKEHSNSMVRLREGSQILVAQQADLIESSKKNTEALQNLVNSSSETKEMIENIANFAKRFFNPVRKGFYLLTGHREPAALLPRENQLAIECNPENTISDTDPINQPPVDEKKNFVSLLIFFVLSAGLYFACAGQQKNL